MDYDYRKEDLRPQLTGYDVPRTAYQPRYDRAGSTQGTNSSFYPRVAQPAGPPMSRPPPPVPKSSSSPSGMGIRVAIKPEYQVGLPVQLSPQEVEVPRCLFQFDFELERRILAEAESRGHSWSRSAVDNSRNGGEPNLSLGIVEDPVVSKYVAMGLGKEAVVLAIASFGDVQNKVLDFCASYSLLREMGFPSDAVAGALAMYDNDRERALSHLV